MTQANEQRLVLHVGPHKTATTYIQQNLNACRASLSQTGWIYPDDVGVSERNPGAHHDLAHRADTYLSSDRENHHQLTEFATQLRDSGKNVILSAEGFSRWSLSKYHKLADILGFQEIEVVYALRDPVALIHSYWAEEVKQGRTVSFPDRIAGATLEPMRSRLLNPLMDINPLISSDRIRLRIIPFEVLKADKTDIFSHICSEILGVEPLSPEITGLVNAGFPIEQTEFLRFLTLLQFQGRTNVGSDLRMAFIRKTKSAERDIWNEQLRQWAKDALRNLTLPADALFRLVIEQRVVARAQAYFTIPVGEGMLFNRQEKTISFYDDYLFWNNPEVNKLAHDVLARLEHGDGQPAILLKPSAEIGLVHAESGASAGHHWEDAKS
ncbi:MAG: hypothetical protein ACNA7O_02260 [Rhodobacterales bacterium]